MMVDDDLLQDDTQWDDDILRKTRLQENEPEDTDDWTDEQWDELVTRRFNNGIESETEVTDTLERPAHESEGWGWSDCRDVALRSGGTVTGELATSVYGARVDYIYASPALLRECGGGLESSPPPAASR